MWSLTRLHSDFGTPCKLRVAAASKGSRLQRGHNCEFIRICRCQLRSELVQLDVRLTLLIDKPQLLTASLPQA
jgi:hypothetical protein